MIVIDWNCKRKIEKRRKEMKIEERKKKSMECREVKGEVKFKKEWIMIEISEKLEKDLKVEGGLEIFK